MKAEQKWKNGQGKLQKKVKKSVGLGICVFLTLLLVSQLRYEKRIQKFVLRNEEELTEFTKNYLAVEQRERRHMFEEWKEENGYSVQLTGLFPEDVVAFYMGGFGLAPSSVYYGFYYSPEDIPVGTGEGQLVKAEGDNAGWSKIKYQTFSYKFIQILIPHSLLERHCSFIQSTACCFPSSVNGKVAEIFWSSGVVEKL